MNDATAARIANLPDPSASQSRRPHGEGMAEWARRTLREEQARTPKAPHRIVTLAVLEATAIRDCEYPPNGDAGWATAETTVGMRAAWVEAPVSVDPYGLAASA